LQSELLYLTALTDGKRSDFFTWRMSLNSEVVEYVPKDSLIFALGYAV